MQEDDASSDIFSCLLGNLPPDTDAVIRFGYVTELSLQPDGTLSFLLPTLLNPRYNPPVECKQFYWFKFPILLFRAFSHFLLLKLCFMLFFIVKILRLCMNKHTKVESR